jgi:hypothetical protein
LGLGRKQSERNAIVSVEIPVGKTESTKVLYMREVPEGPFEPREAKVVVRDWDVTDAEARKAAAEKEVGPLIKEHEQCIHWFIDPARNAAALCVFRSVEDHRVMSNAA